MCGTTKRIHRCGHYDSNYKYCNNSTTNPITNRKNMCANRKQTVSNQSDSLCNKSSSECDLVRCKGNWKCCTCNFEENRYEMCSAGNCTHKICSECSPRY